MEHTHANSEYGDAIYLHIDRYEDIFSDFDARPIAERTLSEDFIEELQRQLYMRDELITGVIFLMPEARRNQADEDAIGERLAAYFRRRVHIDQEARNKVAKRGDMMILAGIAVMSLASFVFTMESDHAFPYSLLRVLLEPASWFLLWEGMNQRFFKISEASPKLDLYTRISRAHANIQFISE